MPAEVAGYVLGDSQLLPVKEEQVIKEMVRYYRSLLTECAKIEYVHMVKNSPLGLKFAKEAKVNLREYR